MSPPPLPVSVPRPYCNGRMIRWRVARTYTVPRMSDNNIWSDDWDPGEDWSGGGARRECVRARAWELGAIPLPPRVRGAAGGAARPPDIAHGTGEPTARRGRSGPLPDGARWRSRHFQRDERAGPVSDGVDPRLAGGGGVPRLAPDHSPGAHWITDRRTPLGHPRRGLSRTGRSPEQPAAPD